MINNKTITSLLHLSDYVKQSLNGRTFIIKKCDTILSYIVYSYIFHIIKNIQFTKKTCSVKFSSRGLYDYIKSYT